MAEKFQIEKSLKKIQEIIDSLKNDETPLNDAFVLYEQGMKEVKRCNNEIEKIEKQIIVLSSEEEINE